MQCNSSRLNTGIFLGTGLLWSFVTITFTWIGFLFRKNGLKNTPRLNNTQKLRLTVMDLFIFGFVHGLIFLLAVAYGWLRFERPPDIEKQQLWKMTYDVELEKIDFKRERHKIYGYGKITQVHHEKYSAIVGHRIYFYLNGEQNFTPTEIITLCSNVRVLHPHNSEPFYRYLVQKHIFLYGYCGKLVQRTAPPTAIRAFLGSIRQHLQKNLAAYRDQNEKTSSLILQGMLLSDRRVLTKEQKDTFHHTGAAHLLAVSGLHIGMIALALDLILRYLCLAGYWRRIPIICLLLLYIGVIGFPPSAIRAWLMLTCFWGSYFLGRPLTGLSSLLFSALLMLLYDPLFLFDIGFQLSYGVVVMLLLLAPILRRRILYWAKKAYLRLPLGITKFNSQKFPYTTFREGKIFRWVRYKLVDSFALSVSAILASAPLTFEYFNLFSLISVFLNPIVIPLALPVVATGFLFLLFSLGGVLEFMPNVFYRIASNGVTLIEGLLSWIEERLPWYLEFVSKPDGFGLGVFLCAIVSAFALYRKEQYRKWCKIHLLSTQK